MGDGNPIFIGKLQKREQIKESLICAQEFSEEEETTYMVNSVASKHHVQ
jgi:hypothetical protein